ncbi:CaiB/BaiF CoA transferase family protein [Bradyrhizobium sp. HKCCYLS20291]|uniref:CaiB/BaiF CoA transferase family protein n=1 Tax=Bradyrhizobium sp. HKCCYLS20291 TaxID=3420766 RepID=UPI003EB69975
MTDLSDTSGCLAGLRILDLSRILAGPTCTQILGDLGADVVKVEKPNDGDDTRKWGAPFVTGTDGMPTAESAYYLCANRNKRSVALDIGTEEGKRTVLALISRSDVLVENFKAGGLARYGLDYASLSQRFPGLIYCSITGFGQSGPYSSRPGYDHVAQAMGGIMSLTGDPDGPPMKVGVGIADVTTGLYATIGILAALRHRDKTGLGQHIDCSLLDTQVSWLINEATNYFLSGQQPLRKGNAHPNICPYNVYRTQDGHVVLAVGNDAQFQRWAEIAHVPDLLRDPRFATNAARLGNRVALESIVMECMGSRLSSFWIDALEQAGVPCGPVNTIEQVFADPHVLARQMKITMAYDSARDGQINLLGSPLKLSRTPVGYRRPPPRLGEHSNEVLAELDVPNE